MAMLNRTADLIGRNVTPLSPALLKLEPEQRMRLLRSTQKVGKVLGTTPTLDVISPSASAFSPVTPTHPAHIPAALNLPQPRRNEASPLSPFRYNVIGPRKRACSIMSAKQSILGADAKLMAEFRTRFGTRPLDFHFPPFPAPTCPLPSPPVSPTLEQVKSPKVPYWVKSSFRPRTSGAYALGFPDVGPYAQVKSASTASRKNGHLAPPATPRTRRVERRQGWALSRRPREGQTVS
ncbi:hypothetical protein BKA93DRAFT_589197 [Sparassis latifolia]